MIKRTLLNTIINNERDGFINVIYGPRRVGKTVLLNQILDYYSKYKCITFNGDTVETRDLLSSNSQTRIEKALKNYDIVAIDEAQRIENIGLTLKIIIDAFPQKKIFVTGSSSIDIARGLKESLTGRTLKYKLYPLSLAELSIEVEEYRKGSLVNELLIYGGYPFIHNLLNFDEKKSYLESIVEDYLFKDILLLKNISQPDTLKKLLTLLSFQVGQQVSFNELARTLQVDVKTVSKYITLLKQSFVIYELGSYSTNLRKEVAKAKKYYFWDLGIRNAVSGQYFDLQQRTDLGSLWENFLILERLKKQEYLKINSSNYFWRTYEKAEVDWIEVGGNCINAFEFKYSPKNVKTPLAFKLGYKTDVKQINKENFLEFIS